MLNLFYQKRRRYEISLLKNEWRFARRMNALKQQSSLNRWHISKSKRSETSWNAKRSKKRRVRTDEKKNRYNSSNFASSCHHHCCCSNKRSFKSEASSSTSVESLLTLFAVALTSYCQVIVVKTMFSPHQVDLSSKNTSFIHTSSVSSSLVMPSTVRYMMFMFAPRSSEILHFDEHNITKFLERFEKQCDEYEVTEKKRRIKLPCYCVRSIAEFMKTFSSYVDRSWKTFEREMRKEYKDQNAEQMINSRSFLKKFKNKTKKNNQMRTYSRQFRSISIKLIKWDQLNIYTQCSWYLQRLSNSYRIKLIRKHNFNSSDLNIMIFELVYKTVIVMTDINDALRELNVLNSKESKDSIDKLINLIRIDQKINKSFSLETAFASSILSAVSAQVTFEKIIESFIKAFKIMHLNSARTVIVDEVQKIVNVMLYRQSINLFVNASVSFEQVSVQVVQINTFNPRDCYGCVKPEHRINDCPKINQLVNSGLIHFNERKRMCFDRAEQEGAEMRL